jgi:serine phosphatase RsbU (regulator of sigma subunit)
MYGEEELERALHHYAELEVDAIVRNIAREVQQHMARLDDDFTLVALKRVGRPLVEGSVN